MAFELQDFSVLKIDSSTSLWNAPNLLWNHIFHFMCQLAWLGQVKYTFSQGKFHKESKNEVVFKVKWCVRELEQVKNTFFSVKKNVLLEVSIFSYHHNLCCPKRHDIWVPLLTSFLTKYSLAVVSAIIDFICKNLRKTSKMHLFFVVSQKATQKC